MANPLEILQERGFVKQCTKPEELGRKFDQDRVTFYAGFDPTAESLHAGSLVPIMAMAHLQRAGLRPIAIVGGGTTMVGDPSGKSEMRQLMTREQIEANSLGILGQLKRYLELEDENDGLFLNNADWLLSLSYVDFLRDIGRHFRVNEMIKFEAYRQRLEREEGLSFLEFNYQLLQAYDFLVLNQRYGCTLQIGGDDQWGNIVAGVDLIRRVESNESFGLTFPLLTTASGAKMGKTADGSVWLDAAKTSPYEFYQYWINTHDADVERFLAFFTFLPMNEVRELSELQGAEIRAAKQVLAYEATKLAHGEVEAEKAKAATKAMFQGASADASAVPTSNVDAARVEQGIPIIDLLCDTGLAASKSVARRLIQQGGAYVNDIKVADIDVTIRPDSFQAGSLMLRSGKKKYHRVLLAK